MHVEPAAAPLVNLTNGKMIPLVGLGTWKSSPGQVYDAVKYAILRAGYRHIDCAFAYQNEGEVGRALHEIISSGAVKREELFITSKCWNIYHSTTLVKPALQQTLALLKLDYLDLFLVHWPFGYQEGGAIFPKTASKVSITSDVDYLDTWKGMEECVAAGLTKTIGVSNFNSQQIKRLLSVAKILPACNQVESHPYLVQSDLIKFCRENEITVVAYSPLGSPDRPNAKIGDPCLIEDPLIVQIARKYNKSPAQVLIKWQVQRGVIVIPKSVTPSRISANIDIFDFELSNDEMATLASFNRGYRFCACENIKGHKYYPFNIPF
jgi:aldehyde reductase